MTMLDLLLAHLANYLQAATAIRIVETENATHILAGFDKWRNTAVLLDRAATRVISCKRKLEITLVAIQQHPQMPHPALDILAWIISVTHVKESSGVGHELHQSHSSL